MSNNAHNAVRIMLTPFQTSGPYPGHIDLPNQAATQLAAFLPSKTKAVLALPRRHGLKFNDGCKERTCGLDLDDLDATIVST